MDNKKRRKIKFTKTFHSQDLHQLYISSRFFENQPYGICSHLCEKASKHAVADLGEGSRGLPPLIFRQK